MKRGKTYQWIPLWVDKWLWGSTRHELAHDERAIFTDLLALAAKDDGWIRANPETPYPIEQLAGMLCAPVDLVKRSLAVCVKFGKLEEPAPGIYRIASWEGYQLTDRRKRDLEPISEKEEGRSKKRPAFSIVSSKSSSPNTKEKELPSEDDICLVQLLIDLMGANNPNSTTLKNLTPTRQAAWIRECRLLREKDGKPVEDIESVIRFSQSDEFWKSNILSMGKLREKWDKLWLKARKADPHAGLKEWLKEKEQEDRDGHS